VEDVAVPERWAVHRAGEGVGEGDSPESGVVCFVCRKHADLSHVPGGLVTADELVVVSHLSPRAPGRDGRAVYLGQLIVEPRHAPGLADLTDAEARDVGWWCTQASRALRDVTGAEFVYAAVIGHAVAHLHVHLVPRYPGTPREFWWQRLDEWPEPKLGGEREIADLVSGLRDCLKQ
jgi:histidine triad (HIT) family protein